MRVLAFVLPALVGAIGLFAAPAPANAQRVFITPPTAVGTQTFYFSPFAQRVFVRRPHVIIVQRGMLSTTGLHAPPTRSRPRANPYSGPGWAPSPR